MLTHYIDIRILSICLSVCHVLVVYFSSRMRVMNHNWSGTKQRQCIKMASSSRMRFMSPDQPLNSVLIHKVQPRQAATQLRQGTGFDSVRLRLGLATRTQISVCKSPPPSAGTAASLLCCCVQKRLSRDHRCRGRSKPGCRIAGSQTR